MEHNRGSQSFFILYKAHTKRPVISTYSCHHSSWMSNMTDIGVLESVLSTPLNDQLSLEQYFRGSFNKCSFVTGENVEDQSIWVAFPMLQRLSKSSLSPTVLCQSTVPHHCLLVVTKLSQLKNLHSLNIRSAMS